MRRTFALLAFSAIAMTSCGAFVSSDSVEGWPDVDLGVPVERYVERVERDLHLHVFAPTQTADDEDLNDGAGAVLFFHGGGFRTTRVHQFEHQARAVAAAGMVGLVVEYRVTAEGTSVADAVDDGSAAMAFVRENAAQLGVDPDRVALAGSSAGGSLALRVSGTADALVLFNPAVSKTSQNTSPDAPALVMHARDDRVIPFETAESFCDGQADCLFVDYETGGHGFFNKEPELTQTTDEMINFLSTHGW